MRSIPMLLCVAWLNSLAAAQTPAPRPRPARPPMAAPALPAPVARPAPAPLGVDQFGSWGEMGLLSGDLHLSQLRDFELLHSSLEFAPELAWNIPLPALPAMPPLALMPEDWAMPIAGENDRGSLARIRPEQGSPEDSLYRSAREALNRGEYARASDLFRTIEQKYPKSRVAPAALYYRAFALYRAGNTDELRAGVEALKAQQERYPEASADPDAAALRTRLYAALAARGDAQAASALRAATSGGPNCDKEDVEVRAEALNALAQIDPAEARPTLKRVLARRDDCSVRLRRTALYILGRSGVDDAAADLLDAARNDPDPTVKNDAIMLLGRSPSATTVRTLETLFNDATDDRTRQSVLSALRNKGGPDATRVLKAIIEREDLQDRMRAEAIMQLAGGSFAWTEAVRPASGQAATVWAAGRRSAGDQSEEAAYLRGLYGRTQSATIKATIISAVARIGGASNDQWLLGIVKNGNEEIRIRREALGRLRVSALSLEDLGKLFESLSERDLRSAVVNQLATREEPAATDKLIEIIKSGTDPQIRREAIAALARKKDPRATRLLLELVEKP